MRVLTGTGDDGEPGQVEAAGMVPGTLEFTTATGLRYRRTPSRATPPVDLDDPLIATAVAHADLRAAQQAVGQARMDAENAAHQERVQAADRVRRAGAGLPPAAESDGQDRAWRRSLADDARRRLRATANRTADRAARRSAADLDPPF